MTKLNWNRPCFTQGYGDPSYARYQKAYKRWKRKTDRIKTRAKVMKFASDQSRRILNYFINDPNLPASWKDRIIVLLDRDWLMEDKAQKVIDLCNKELSKSAPIIL